MTDYLADYKEYYRARAARWADNPRYQRMYAAEQALSDAMDSCTELEQFRQRMGDLNERCAVAWVMDKYSMEAALFAEIHEPVRAQVARQVLERAPACRTANQVNEVCAKAEMDWMIPISMDERVRGFADWKLLEDLEVEQRADIPSRWDADRRASIERDTRAVRDGYASDEEYAQPWQPGWRYDFEQVFQYRHRRLIPVHDQVVRRRIAQVEQLLGR